MKDLLQQKYIDIHNNYEKIYGKNKFLVLMQIGGFYVLYATNDKGPNLDIVSKQTNMVKTRMDKSINAEISIKNPYMMGFPDGVLDKYIQILLNCKYVLIVIDQIKLDNGIDRSKHNIITNGTYLDIIDNNTNYILSIYLTSSKYKNKKQLTSSGLTLLDLSANKLYVLENYSTILDEYYTYSEINRIIEMNCPKEIIIYLDETLQQTEIENEIKSENLTFKQLKKEYTNLDYQIETLNEIYKTTKSNLSIIELLNLEQKPLILISLIACLNYIQNTNPKLLINLQQPVLYSDNNNMILGNNAVLQLNLFKSSENVNAKYTCLFDIINKTLTPFGERFMKHRLLTPLINKTELELIYELTDYLLINNININNELKNIKDIEKIYRKIELGICKPSELYILYKSFEYIKIILEYQNLNTIKNKNNITLSVSNIIEILEYIEKIFNVTELYKFINYKNRIFNNNIYPEIDILTKNISNYENFYKQLKIKWENEYKLKYNKQIILKLNNKDDYFFSCSNKIADELKKILDDKTYDIDDVSISSKNIDYKKLKNTKIYIKGLSHVNDDDKLERITKQYYLTEIKNIDIKFNKTINESIKYITLLDFLNCNAQLKTTYNYTKPIIVNKNNGYVKAEQLRHPIIEQIITTKYIPHNIELGNDIKGLLIYGINSAGKSSLMKKLGLSLIMAQCGLYVPASKFEFSPYKSIYTRISAQDDIFKGHSSFAIEMIELNNIIKYANEHTLIIGDEICRSTENISGNAIVAATILSLVNKNASFMIATHLHELMTLDEIKNCTSVKACHVQVKYINGKLEYNRELLDGSGDNIYGITVANFILQNKEFIDIANNIKNKLINQYDIINNKTSKYNNKLYVTKCEICGTNKLLETHHIHYQKDCINNFINTDEHIQKNNIANLIVICQKCHDNIHSKNIVINDYKFTSNGKELDIS